MHGAGNRGVGLLGRHDVEDRVNDLIAADTENGCAEDEFGFGVDHHLHEALCLPLLHGSPYACHRSLAHQSFSAGFANLVHGHACAAEWRVDVKRIGGDAVTHPPRVVVEQVGGDDLEVVVRRVRECTATVAIAHRPDVFDVGT